MGTIIFEEKFSFLLLIVKKSVRRLSVELEHEKLGSRRLQAPESRGLDQGVPLRVREASARESVRTTARRSINKGN